MIFLRKILFPFAILYGWISSIRNFLFDTGFLKSYSFNIPIIAVGNLSVGGTGKSPQIEYLIRLLSNNYKVATLSRGYKRKSEGFILADQNTTAEIIGDEPFQFFRKFKNIQVAVDANRKNGIEQLLSQQNKPDVILLDDAYQHRKVKAGFYILLTSYNDLFADDFMLPTGNLRESRNGFKRANIIIVTKCPKNISQEAQKQIANKFNLQKSQQLFFSFIDYDECVYSETENIKLININDFDKILVAGIAKPESFFAYLHSKNDFVMKFPDHHHFTAKDITEIKHQSEGKIVITTEKDFVRLSDKLNSKMLYYLPIKSKFVGNENDFDQTILDYVGKGSRIC